MKNENLWFSRANILQVSASACRMVTWCSLIRWLKIVSVDRAPELNVSLQNLMQSEAEDAYSKMVVKHLRCL